MRVLELINGARTDFLPIGRFRASARPIEAPVLPGMVRSVGVRSAPGHEPLRGIGARVRGSGSSGTRSHTQHDYLRFARSSDGIACFISRPHSFALRLRPVVESGAILQHRVVAARRENAMTSARSAAHSSPTANRDGQIWPSTWPFALCDRVWPKYVPTIRTEPSTT